MVLYCLGCRGTDYEAKQGILHRTKIAENKNSWTLTKDPKMVRYKLFSVVLLTCHVGWAPAQPQKCARNEVVEFSRTSTTPYSDPFNEVEVDVVFTKAKQIWRVPAFWAGRQQWKVRFAPPQTGTYHYRWECTDANNPDLNGHAGTLEVSEYQGANKLLLRGHLRISENHRYFEHADGTPFFWLGDTWWKGLCSRLHWSGFQRLTADRRKKGFTVIQMVAGLYPDEPPFDERAENEGGWVWEPNYARINPKYFDYADRRIKHLVDSELVPCIVGSWGYYMPWMGVTKMKQHWRNLVARYGAYPVVWCLAGEWTMGFYVKTAGYFVAERLSVSPEQAWLEVAKYVKSIDPYHSPVCVHEANPTKIARILTKDDPYLLDFDMLQTGHGELDYVGKNTIGMVSACRSMIPTKPVIVGEVTYERHQQLGFPPVQRFLFWTSILNGACGHTYGAGGIWQMNAPGNPHGPSPHGGTYEDIPWNEAMNFEGSTHLGIGKALLMRYQWWRFEPHQDWVEPAGKSFAEPHDTWYRPLVRWNREGGNFMLPYAAGIPREVRIIYIPCRRYNWSGPTVKKLEKDVTYRAFYFDPATGREYDVGRVPREASQSGSWKAPPVPLAQDWVLVLEKAT